MQYLAMFDVTKDLHNRRCLASVKVVISDALASLNVIQICNDNVTKYVLATTSFA